MYPDHTRVLLVASYMPLLAALAEGMIVMGVCKRLGVVAVEAGDACTHVVMLVCRLVMMVHRLVMTVHRLVMMVHRLVKMVHRFVV